MKVVYAALIMLLVIGIFIGIHSFVMARLSSDLDAVCKNTERLAAAEDWTSVSDELEKAQEKWDKCRLWATLTISTNEIDKIEISLRQSMAFAKLKAKPDFFGEFTVFHMLINRIKLKEGIHLDEIL